MVSLWRACPLRGLWTRLRTLLMRSKACRPASCGIRDAIAPAMSVLDWQFWDFLSNKQVVRRHWFPILTLGGATGSSTNALAGVCFRNSFYWGPRQYPNLSTTNMFSFTANDYLRGRMQHWLEDVDQLDLTGKGSGLTNVTFLIHFPPCGLPFL